MSTYESKPTNPPLYAPWRHQASLLSYQSADPSAPPRTTLPGYPVAIGLHLLVGHCIAIEMWFYNLLLASGGWTYEALLRLSRKKVLPSVYHHQGGWAVSFKDTFDKDNPPEAPTRCKRYSPANPHPIKKKLLLSAMAMMGSVVGKHDTFDLSANAALRRNLRHYRSKLDGRLDTNKIPRGPVLHALQMKLRESHEMFVRFTSQNPDSYSSILDTGASWTAINDKSLCDPGSIHKLDEPIELDGIAGGLLIEYTGKMKAETIDKHGNVFPFETTVLIHEDLPGILVSPQALLKDQTDNVDDHFRIYHDRVEWHAREQHLLNLYYDSSFLPRFQFFKRGQAESSLKAFHSTIHDSNKNLSAPKKIWLKWHNKLNHISFSHVRKLALGGYLDKHALGLSQLPMNEAPQCEACKYGKQTHCPWTQYQNSEEREGWVPH